SVRLPHFPTRRSSDLRREGARDVPATIRKLEAPLARRRARATNELLHRELPAAAELARQPLRGMVDAFEAAVAVGRDVTEGDDRSEEHTSELQSPDHL